MHRNTAALPVTLILLLTSVSSHGTAGEAPLYARIRTESRKGGRAAVLKLADEFLRKYPKSGHVPEVLVMKSEVDPDPDRAIRGYAAAVWRFGKKSGGDYAQLRICEILYLQARYRELMKESEKAITKFPASTYRHRFTMYLARSYYLTGMYARAKSICAGLIEKNHDPSVLPEALLFMAGIEKKISGYSKNYIATLKDLVLGFPESQEIPGAISMIGEYYEYRGSADKSFSAYTDLTARFPGSPESDAAAAKLGELGKNSPRLVEYLPDRETVDAAEEIALSHDISAEEGNGSYFSVSVGPLDDERSVRELKGLLREFSTLSARTRDGFMLYVGKSASTDIAMSVKIRLAEEFGINGVIVKFSGSSGRKYIYGE